MDRDGEGRRGGRGSTAQRCLQKDGDARVSGKQGLKKCQTRSRQVRLIPGRIPTSWTGVGKADACFGSQMIVLKILCFKARIMTLTVPASPDLCGD